MAVLVTAEVPGMTPEIYDGMIAMLGPKMRHSLGFLAHGAGMVDGVWQVVELWETEEEATKWFSENVQPNLPEGITPKRTLAKLHHLITR